MNNGMKENKYFKLIENIWYHYKYVILIALAAVIMITVATCQMLSKKEPDIFIYHISTEGLSVSAKEHFLSNMQLVAADYNGDGTVKADLKEDVYIPDVANVVQNVLTTNESFNRELALGECGIYVMDEIFLNGNKVYMTDLQEVLGYVPEYAVYGKAVKISDLPSFSKLSGLKYMKDEYICVRQKRDGIKEKDYMYNLEFYRALFGYES